MVILDRCSDHLAHGTPNMQQATTTPQPQIVPWLRAGEWVTDGTTRFDDVYNPSTGQVIARVPLCSADEAAKVVEAAHAALPGWSDTPVVERARAMFRLRQLMERDFEELAALVTREHGKTIA